MEALEGLLADAEDVLRKLGLPYRVVVLATGDKSFSSVNTMIWKCGSPAKTLTGKSLVVPTAPIFRPAGAALRSRKRVVVNPNWSTP